jgi:hypothetical protein
MNLRPAQANNETLKKPTKSKQTKRIKHSMFENLGGSMGAGPSLLLGSVEF